MPFDRDDILGGADDCFMVETNLGGCVHSNENPLTRGRVVE